MFLAEEVAESGTRFFMFDIFMVLFTIVIAFGVFRLLKQPKRNLFALGFAGTCLVIFLAADALMVWNWLGKM